MKNSLSVFLIFFHFLLLAQPEDSLSLKKGSYLYFGKPAIEDNSMLIEEAFIQEASIVQHISNFFFDRDQFSFLYTQEIPLENYSHQLSYTIKYSTNNLSKGFEDLLINYKPLLRGKKDWALITPRFTLILPTGDASKGLGNGAWAGQFNLAITKRIGPDIVTHWNAGYTLYYNADRYDMDLSGNSVLTHEKNLDIENLGASVIWFARPTINFMLEYISIFKKEITQDGSLTSSHILTVNPGFRFAFSIGKVQIVPGIGIPVEYINGRFGHSWVFGYLSIEQDYNK